MSKHKLTTPLCCIIVALTLALTALLMRASAFGGESAPAAMGYEDKLFDDSYVHAIDIRMGEADWTGFIQSATDEQYVLCDLVIDGEAFGNVAIRAKGNTSLSSVASYGNDRYSFKIEFDHFTGAGAYYGLDKLVLNNNIQDNTLMKDYLTYKMMASLSVPAPLASYVWVTVNGENWGLYLALEGVEESFLMRNYGSDYGELYKPDSISMGGGRGNGKDFDFDAFRDAAEDFSGFDRGALPGADESSGIPDAMPSAAPDASGNGPQQGGFPGQGQQFGTAEGEQGQRPGAGEGGAWQGGFPDGEQQGDFQGGAGQDGFPGMAGGGNAFGGMGSSDVSLIYSDDDPASYTNIFDSAKTALSSADKRRLIAALKRLNENTDIGDTVDVEAVIGYFAAHNFVVNFDSYTGSMIHNYYLYEKDGVLSMIPWDYNLAFGGFQSASDATALVNYPVDSPTSGGTTDSRPMLAWIFNDEGYLALYHARLSAFIADFFESGTFKALLDETVAMLSPYVERDANGFCTYDEFLAAVKTLREFCLRRAESIRGQLEGVIPSTSEGQAADASALIDGSDLDIDSMGSMGGMGRNNGAVGFTPPAS